MNDEFISECTLTPVTPERRSHGVLEKYRTRGACSTIASSNAVASPVDAVGSHRAPSDGVHFEHAQNKRRRSLGVLIEHRGVAVRSP